jgi:hypothetical protein
MWGGGEKKRGDRAAWPAEREHRGQGSRAYLGSEPYSWQTPLPQPWAPLQANPSTATNAHAALPATIPTNKPLSFTHTPPRPFEWDHQVQRNITK